MTAPGSTRTPDAGPSGSAEATFVTRFDVPAGGGPALAVKDLIDVAGVVTTAGSKAVADEAEPAERDALCLEGARTAGARIVGKTNLHELALGVTGVNPWYGTPVNPLDPTRVPGGSSSGSAVAVATGEADVAYGSDTGGSVRIPSACCGTAGLKTTWGRVPLEGVRALAPSFDTVGPMARDVGGLVLGMQLLEPGFEVARPEAARSLRVARLVVEAEPAISAAVDGALGATGWSLSPLELEEWNAVSAAAGILLVAEAWETLRPVITAHPRSVGADVAHRATMGRDVGAEQREAAWRRSSDWRRRLEAVFESVDLVATPTLTVFPPRIEDGEQLLMARCTLPVNLAGVPALSVPVSSGGLLPASLQLIGPAGSEELLLAAGLVVEASAPGPLRAGAT